MEAHIILIVKHFKQVYSQWLKEIRKGSILFLSNNTLMSFIQSKNIEGNDLQAVATTSLSLSVFYQNNIFTAGFIKLPGSTLCEALN